MIRSFLRLVEPGPSKALVVHPAASQRAPVVPRLARLGYQVLQAADEDRARALLALHDVDQVVDLSASPRRLAA